MAAAPAATRKKAHFVRNTAVARYVEVKLATASPGELLLALYDRIFYSLAGARRALLRGNRSQASEEFGKVRTIISELHLALDHEMAPELCEQLGRVYGFAMDQLTRANIDGSVDAVDELTRVLTPLREAWAVAVPQAAIERAAERIQ